MELTKYDNIIVADPLVAVAFCPKCGNTQANPEFEVYYAGEIKFMNRNDVCFCGSGKKVKHCHRDINEKSLLAKMLALYAGQR